MRKISLSFHLVVLLSAMSLALSGQKSLSIEEAVAIALRENLAIEISRVDQRISEKNARWIQAGYLPELGASGSYNWQRVDISQELNVGSDTTGGPPPRREFKNAISQNYQAEIGASWLLFDGLGRINNFRKLQLQEEMSETQLQMSIEQVLLQLYSNYYEVARQRELLDISRESLALSQERYQRARAAQSSGSGNRLDELNALVALRQDSSALYQSLHNWQSSRRALGLVLNWPVDTVYRLDSSVNLRSDLDFMALRQKALQSSSALIQARLKREISEKNLAIARSQRLPQISANGGYLYSRQANEGGFLLFQQTTGLQYGLNARWDFFQGYRSQTQIENARLQIFKDQLSLEQSQREVESDLVDAWQNFELQKRLYKLEKRNLEIAALNFQRSEAAFRLGQSSNIALREAQLDYIRSKARLSELRYQSKIAEIDLQRVAGALVY